MTKAQWITREVARKFPSFGGGRVGADNPISFWMQYKPPAFALGVDIQEVVEFVLKAQKREGRKP